MAIKIILFYLIPIVIIYIFYKTDKITSITKKTESIVFSFINFLYVIIYKTDKEVINSIKIYVENGNDHLNLINKIKCSSTKNIIWLNTGTFFGILMSFWAFFVSLELSIIGSIKEMTMLHFVFAIVYAFLFVIVITPPIVKRILKNLSPKEYAIMAISNLNESEILISVSLHMNELCTRFINATNEVKNVVLYVENEKLDSSRLFQNINNFKEHLSLLKDSLHTFNTQNLSLYSQCVELKELAANILEIKEREFTHHVLQFSPVIFRQRLLLMMQYLENLDVFLNQSNQFENTEGIEHCLNEINTIYQGVLKKRDNSIRQLILFPNIHYPLLRMASMLSSSKSLEFFIDGITMPIIRYETNPTKRNELNFQRQVFGELISLLHRSKAHYGMDLLLLLENYIRKYQLDHKILDFFKHALRINVNYNNYTKCDHENLSQLILYNMKHVKNLRDMYFKTIHPTKSSLLSNFINSINTCNGENNLYCLVGYSRNVKQLLQSTREYWKDKVIFVLKDDRSKMLDTRIMRFELNSGINKIQNTFTASDSFLISLINTSNYSNIIFITGTEAYFEKEKLLFHTNNYQKRIHFLLSECRVEKEKFKFWVISEKWKIFETFPPISLKFGSEIVSDHYDNVDLYNFNGWESRIKLITD